MAPRASVISLHHFAQFFQGIGVGEFESRIQVVLVPRKAYATGFTQDSPVHGTILAKLLQRFPVERIGEKEAA